MYDAYKQRRTALVISGKYREELVNDLIKDNWDITDLGLFFENLPLWYPKAPSGEEMVKLLFSDPIPGIKQHLLNHKEVNVGVSGDNLTEIDQPLLFEYHRRGYDVVSITCQMLFGKVHQTIEHIPCITNMVKLTKKKLK